MAPLRGVTESGPSRARPVATGGTGPGHGRVRVTVRVSLSPGARSESGASVGGPDAGPGLRRRVHPSETGPRRASRVAAPESAGQLAPRAPRQPGSLRPLTGPGAVTRVTRVN
jgi:hypothetical protein